MKSFDCFRELHVLYASDGIIVVFYVFVEVENDVYFGLGFVYAQDRLWQMLMLRRTAQGWLSEIFGEDTLRIDRLLRFLELYPVAQAAEAYQTEDTMVIFWFYLEFLLCWDGILVIVLLCFD